MPSSWMTAMNEMILVIADMQNSQDVLQAVLNFSSYQNAELVFIFSFCNRNIKITVLIKHL